MAEIFPFAAYRYDPERVNLTDVVTQPYDKITPVMQERYAQTPNNLITVEKGRSTPDDSPDNNVYTRAEKALEGWIRSGILKRDPAPGIYVYSQEYTVPGGAERRTRRGFIALGRVEDYSAGVIFRHEHTLAGPKADRLELLRHTRTHTGQLFMLYTDAERRIDTLLDAATRANDPVEVRDEYGVTHRLWPILDGPGQGRGSIGTKDEIIAEIVQEMANQKLVIADGHHRYETALAYRNECRARADGSGASADRDAPYEKTMMTFFNTRSEGLLILPTHRVISNVRGFDAAAFRRKISDTFEQAGYAFGSDASRAVASYGFQRDLAASGRSGRAIGMYTPGEFTLFRLRPGTDLATLMPEVPRAQRDLDVILLHRLMLENGLDITSAAVSAEQNITYEREMGAAVEAVDAGRAQACFFLNPVDVEQVTRMALAGDVLPQKSTDFYPKLLSGLALYRLR